MNQHKFYPLQEPQPEELNEALTDTITNLAKRVGVILEPGILPANKLNQLLGATGNSIDARFSHLGEFSLDIIPGALDGSDDACTLNIGSGMAFAPHAVNDHTESPYELDNPVDNKLERIFISPSALIAYDPTAPSHTDVLGNPQPKSTGSQGIILNPRDPITHNRQPSITYYIYAAYLAVVDTATDDPSNPGNKYSINPATGQIDYVHFVDGYQIRLLTVASTDPDDVLLGVVTCTSARITDRITTGRKYAHIPASLVRTQLRADLAPAAYGYAAIDLTDHVNAIGDPALVSAANPHGTRLNDISGATAQGPYVQSPQNFQAFGIIDKSVLGGESIPGPFWPTIGSHAGMAVVNVGIPGTAQDLYINGVQFDATSNFYSQVRNDAGDNWAMKQIFSTDDIPVPLIRVEFPVASLTPPIGRSAGIYIIAGDYGPAGITGVTGPGLEVSAVYAGTSGAAAILNPYAFINAAQYPIAAVNWTGTGFDFLQDPLHNNYQPASKVIDLRKFGTIGSDQISSLRRYYTAGDTGPAVDQAVINHNIVVGKNLSVTGKLTALGGITATGDISGTRIIGDGSLLTNLPQRLNGMIHSTTTSSNLSINSSMGWFDLLGMSLNVNTVRANTYVMVYLSGKVLPLLQYTPATQYINFRILVDGDTSSYYDYDASISFQSGFGYAQSVPYRISSLRIMPTIGAHIIKAQCSCSYYATLMVTEELPWLSFHEV